MVDVRVNMRVLVSDIGSGAWVWVRGLKEACCKCRIKESRFTRAVHEGWDTTSQV
jgi:hypothetical protein